MKLHTITITILALLLISCGNDAESELDKSGWQQQAIPVQVDTARYSTYTNFLSFNGALQAIQVARIIPEIPAKIAAQVVNIGDWVVKGDTLAQMDISALELQYEQARAGFKLAEASLADARKDWSRVETLRGENAVSEQQYEKARLGLEAGQAQLSQARAGLDLLKMQLDKSTLTAPFDGVVTQKGFEVGDLFSPAIMMPLYTVQNVSRIKVELQVPSKEIPLVENGQTARLWVDYLADPVRGEVTLHSIAADPLSKTFFVECQFDNSNGALRAGTFGKVEIAVHEIPGVIVVPRKAIVNDDDIFVMQDDRAYRRDISILELSELHAVVVAGLEVGEAYISEGGYILADSSLVRVRE